MTTDTEPDIARDGGPYSVREALAALDFQIARAARNGDYGLHTDLVKIHELIESQEQAIDELRSAGGSIFRRIKAGLESLGREPT